MALTVIDKLLISHKDSDKADLKVWLDFNGRLLTFTFYNHFDLPIYCLQRVFDEWEDLEIEAGIMDEAFIYPFPLAA